MSAKLPAIFPLLLKLPIRQARRTPAAAFDTVFN